MESLTVRLGSEIYSALQEAAKECQLPPERVASEVLDCWIASRRQKADMVSEPRSLMPSSCSPGYLGHIQGRSGHKGSV